MKLFAKILCLPLVLALLLATGTGCSGNETVRVAVGATSPINCTGIYTAMEHGIYKKNGMNVKIIQGGDPLGLVSAGEAEFAIVSQGELAPALTAEEPSALMAVGAVTSRNTLGILSLGGIISSPIDFCGKRVATRGTPLEREVIRHMVELDGGNFEEVEMVLYEGDNAFSDLQAGVADAIWIDLCWVGDVMRLGDVEFNYIALPAFDPALDFYSSLFVGESDWVPANAALTKAFLAATDEGCVAAEESMEQMVDVVLEYMPEADYNLVLESLGFITEDRLFRSTIYADHWTRFNDWMYERGLLERPLGGEGFTNTFLPKGRDM